MTPPRLRPVLALLLATLVAGPAVAGSYLAGGTFVVKSELGTLVDNGGVVCVGTDGDGVGGGCLLFPASRVGFVSVVDEVVGAEVAFQVCIDNNGDGICGGPQLDPRCFDQIFFSHDDSGRFFNPLGPLPASFLPGCREEPGGFAGYVVLLCQGSHDTDVVHPPHTHTPTQGTISRADSGSGYGDFCGGGDGGVSPPGLGNSTAVAKGYVVV